MVASERDFAVSQMREMAEQVQTVAGEFKSMADHCDHVMKELEQVDRKELITVRFSTFATPREGRPKP